MFCAISGEAPENPVLSRASGSIFEKRLLEAYISEHGKDPINGEALTVDDVVEIKTSRIAKPRPPTASSIPSLLSIFQNEWDSLALETYQMKLQLHSTRQELSTALYQHDAACRVIARITKERDEARDALSKVSENLNIPRQQEDSASAAGGGETTIPQDIQELVQSTMETEGAGRKKRKQLPDDAIQPEQLSHMKRRKATKADLKRLESSTTIAVHPSKQFNAMSAASNEWTLNRSDETEITKLSLPSKINCLAFHPDGHLVALGCEDGNIYIYMLLTAKIEATFGPGTGAITALAFSRNGFWLAAVGENERLVKIWHLGKNAVAAELDVAEGTKSVVWDDTGRFLACVGSSGLKVWAYSKESKSWIVPTELEGDFTHVAWAEDGKRLILGGEAGNTVLQVDPKA